MGSHHLTLSLIRLAHVPILFAFGLWQGWDVLHLSWEVGILVGLLAIGWLRFLGPLMQSTAVSVGLMGSSALLVHLSGGYIEAHFHFFVLLPVVALYQRWTPFVASVGFVLLHHGITGVLDPTSVYNHPAAIAQPWIWASIHAGFVALECLALFRLWQEVEHGQSDAERARSATAAIRQVQAVKERLLRVASHELNTPLTPIKIQLHMMGQHSASTDVERREAGLDVMRRNFDRLERVVASVLDVVRIDSDELRLDLTEHDISDLAKLALASYRDMADMKGVELVTELEPAIAVVDANRISQVLDNLLSNAIKYTAAGDRVTVRVRKRKSHVSVEVIDSGLGLAQDEIARLFEPFAMVHGATTQADGTGLGLYVCKGIVEAHGGTIRAESEGTGRGSTFIVELPYLTRPADQQRDRVIRTKRR